MKESTLLALALASLVTLKAQWVNDPVNNMKELSTGIYILQGFTKNGRIVSKKLLIDKKE